MPDIDYGQILEALNDKVDLSGSWSAPSTNYIDLTLGASGTTYTAPADGFVVLNQRMSAGYWLLLTNESKSIALECSAPVNNANLSYLLPVKKDDIFKIAYDTGLGNTDRFRFIYAQKTN